LPQCCNAIAAIVNFKTRLNNKLSAKYLTNNKNQKITAISVNVNGRAILVNNIIYFYFGSLRSRNGRMIRGVKIY